MKLSSVGFYLRNPITAVRTIGYKFYEWTHPDEPWLSQGSIRYLEKHLKPDMKVFEWGSGRSTLWFAKRTGRVVSIEYHEGWYHKVKEMIADSGLKHAEVRYLPLEHPKQDPTPIHYDPIPKYVSEIFKFADNEFDLVIVDGHYRLTCVDQCLNKIKPGGYILIDNSNRVPRNEWMVPESWALVHESENVKTRTSIWQKPTTCN